MDQPLTLPMIIQYGSGDQTKILKGSFGNTFQNRAIYRLCQMMSLQRSKCFLILDYANASDINRQSKYFRSIFYDALCTSIQDIFLLIRYRNIYCAIEVIDYNSIQIIENIIDNLRKIYTSINSNGNECQPYQHGSSDPINFVLLVHLKLHWSG